MSTKTQDEIAKRLAAALNERSRAKQYVAADNPVGAHSLTDLVHGVGVRTGADQFPAKSMADGGEGLGYQMEVARNQALRDGRADKSTKRSKQARARAQRKVKFDKIADSPVIPPAARMEEAWHVVFPLVPTITKVANSKKRWASRFLGSNVDDIAQMALEKMALVLAKSDRDLGVLRVAAEQLGQVAKDTGRVPGDQLSDDERKERKEIAKARKWLMGMVNNRVMGALVDSYTDLHNLRWDNIDLISTVMASISGVGDDPMLSRFKADRAPAFLGTRFQKPGGIDGNLLAAAIAGAITERRLDPMVEIMLDESNRRVDGAMMWTECAEAIFKATPDDGEWLWEAVCRATAGKKREANRRGEAAQKHVRSQFAWLPSLIVSAVESFDPHPIGWGLKSTNEVYASKVEPVRQIATVRVNRGASVVASPKPAFDGTVRDDVYWPETVGRPVGPECIEEVEVAWHLRKARVQRAARLQAVLASDFELFYCPDGPERRGVLRPALVYGSAEEATWALLDNLANLVTGNDLVAAVVHA